MFLSLQNIFIVALLLSLRLFLKLLFYFKKVEDISFLFLFLTNYQLTFLRSEDLKILRHFLHIILSKSGDTYISDIEPQEQIILIKLVLLF